MLGKSEHEETSDRLCQGTAANQPPCNLAGTVHCVRCDLWFCDVHAEDEEWHACMKAMN